MDKRIGQNVMIWAAVWLVGLTVCGPAEAKDKPARKSGSARSAGGVGMKISQSNYDITPLSRKRVAELAAAC